MDKEKQKAYRLSHKEEMKKYSKKYYILHIKEIKKKNKENQKKERKNIIENIIKSTGKK